ncbi:MAG TPA: hypothetical protein VGF98_14780 [Candidatus Tumulicola sp.]
MIDLVRHEPREESTKPSAPLNPFERLERDAEDVDLDVREGRFGRWLALAAGLSSALSGLEVGYEHYKGSYSRRIMYTPVVLSTALFAAGTISFYNRRASRTLLPFVSAVTLADCAVGFYFHVRGIARKPGGWRLPIVNIVMGPPVFAPLLFGVSAYLGLVAAFLRRDDGNGRSLPRPASSTHWAKRFAVEHEPISWEQDLREGRFQRCMIVATIAATSLSGFEAWYSHYRNNFRYPVQWTPVILTPIVVATGIAALRSVRVAQTALPAVSALAVIDGGIGCFFHVRGTLRRAGGSKNLLYNIIYGPPIFAPMLFAASGALGILASLLRRGKRR